jgi:hypothetical protein
MDDAMSEYLKAQARAVEDINMNRRRLAREEERLALERQRMEEDRFERAAQCEATAAERAAAAAVQQAHNVHLLMMMDNVGKVMAASTNKLGYN